MTAVTFFPKREHSFESFMTWPVGEKISQERPNLPVSARERNPLAEEVVDNNVRLDISPLSELPYHITVPTGAVTCSARSNPRLGTPTVGSDPVEVFPRHFCLGDSESLVRLIRQGGRDPIQHTPTTSCLVVRSKRHHQVDPETGGPWSIPEKPS
jgi:hypothetical protein